MKEVLKVKKWWGENAAELEQSPQNIVKDFKEGIKQAVVVSAIRSPEFNTTDKLILLWKTLGKKEIDVEKVEEIICSLKKFHIEIIDEKIRWENEGLKKQVTAYFTQFERDILHFVKYRWEIVPSEKNDYLIETKDGKLSVLWFWEELSAEVQSLVINDLQEKWLHSENLDLTWVLENVNIESWEENIFKHLSENISRKVHEILEQDKVPIIPGYIPGFEEGIEKTIGRGYSDATASMASVWLSNAYKVTLEIQKSVEGMLSSDPRLLADSEAKLIEEIDYITAKEITWIRWAQAKLLHSQVLRRELQESWIEVHLYDPFRETKGTIISKNKSETSNGVEYIWARDNVIFFSISSWHMYDRWLLANIFKIVKKYSSVDIISTSETEISFTIDNDLDDESIDNLKNEIRKSVNFDSDDDRNKVEYFKNKALIFCVGQNLSNALWSLWRAATSLYNGGINIELVSQWAKERAMVFGINSDEMIKAVNILHKEFIK